jgi:hypothetical protein
MEEVPMTSDTWPDGTWNRADDHCRAKAPAMGPWGPRWGLDHGTWLWMAMVQNKIAPTKIGGLRLKMQIFLCFFCMKNIDPNTF